MGYRYENGRYVIQPDKAEIVRRIFREYPGGKGVDAIANDLNADGIPTRLGYKWRNNGVLWILRNYTYTGNLLLQKYYRDDYISKKSRINRGQMPRFHVTAAHDPIICVEDYEAVQEEIERRRTFRQEHGLRGLSGGIKSPFYSRFFCEECGSRLQRKYPKGASRPYWQCLQCGRRIEDKELRALFCDAFNDLVDDRDTLLPGWKQIQETGTPLQKIRARQLMELTACGTIPYEAPRLTQAVLQEASLGRDGKVRFRFLSGDQR
jgi:hypothetical protein